MVRATFTYLDREVGADNYFSIHDFFTGGVTSKSEDMNVWMPEFIADVQDNTRELRATAERLRRMTQKEKAKKEAINKVFTFFRTFFGFF